MSSIVISKTYDLSIWTLQLMKRRDLMWWSLTCVSVSKLRFLWKALMRGNCCFLYLLSLAGYILSQRLLPASARIGLLLPHFSWSLINFDKVETLPGSTNWQSMFKLVVYAWWEHTLTYFRRVHKNCTHVYWAFLGVTYMPCLHIKQKEKCIYKCSVVEYYYEKLHRWLIEGTPYIIMLSMNSDSSFFSKLQTFYLFYLPNCSGWGFQYYVE